MKPRHATALAFVGWYLMAPPAFPGRADMPLRENMPADRQFDEHAPLSRWSPLGTTSSRTARTVGHRSKSCNTTAAATGGWLTGQSTIRATLRDFLKDPKETVEAANEPQPSAPMFTLAAISGGRCSYHIDELESHECW